MENLGYHIQYPNIEEFILGSPNRTQLENLTFLLIKKLLYDTKFRKEKLSPHAFENYLKRIQETEEYTAKIYDKMGVNNSKWNL